MGAFQLAESLKNEENLVFLHSGMAPGTKSIVAWGLEKKLEKLPQKLDAKYFGYLGYGLRNKLEDYPRNKNSIISLPDILLINFKNEQVFERHCEPEAKQSSLDRRAALAMTINSNMSDAEYLEKAQNIITKIHDGELYQANLTRKFFGEFKSKPDAFALFSKLSQISPAPYSAYIKFGDTHIISASPEKFLTIENGLATTTPIKGTLSAESPAALLAMSEKDRAENLMIVDLMRNDLSKTCANVKVEKLFEVTSYAKYHHMSSTITGELNPHPIPLPQGEGTTESSLPKGGARGRVSPLEVALGCFPPGSMTGAPKIHAVKLCSELEQIERGVYSGALGWIGPDACDLSVVIRTLIIQGNKFEFQVGGGIVADSTPQKELEEIYVKARPIFEVLSCSVSESNLSETLKLNTPKLSNRFN